MRYPVSFYSMDCFSIIDSEEELVKREFRSMFCCNLTDKEIDMLKCRN